MIHVCSLARLHETVADSGARHVVSLLDDAFHIERPRSVAPENHLRLRVHDISVPLDGYVLPEEQHVADLLDFVRVWDRRTPLVVHCFAGISRSTAAAFTAACVLNPARDEEQIARAIRAASPTAQPNARIVSIADRLLKREGRMIRAVENLGPGEPATEGHPFRLDLD